MERAFRSLKTMDLKVRPIHHHLEGRVRAHIFLCMLAYCVEWHMRQAWRELMFADEDQAAKLTRDPVAPAKRSDAGMKKVCSLALDDGSPVHNWHSLMAELSTIVRNACRAPNGPADAPTFQITTMPNPKQKRALDRISQIKMQTERGTTNSGSWEGKLAFLGEELQASGTETLRRFCCLGCPM